MTRLANIEKAAYFPLPPPVTELILSYIAAPFGGRGTDRGIDRFGWVGTYPGQVAPPPKSCDGLGAAPALDAAEDRAHICPPPDE